MRRHLDQYFTPLSATRVLLKYQPNISGTILEPCVGQGDLAAPLRQLGRVVTNDIDPLMPATLHEDAALGQFWERFRKPSAPEIDWVVSNPPFSCCQPIIEGAFSVARRGVAMLLRLSYLEPCNNRAGFLSANPPSLIVLPRISFTGDGKTDNVTCAWLVWDFNTQERQVRIVTKDEVSALMMSQNNVAEPYEPESFQFVNPCKEASKQAKDELSVLRSAAMSDRLRDVCDL